MRLKTRRELPWLYYPEHDRVIINSHNFTPSLLLGLQWYWDLDAAGATITDSQSGLVLTKGGTVTVSTGGAPDGGDCIDLGATLGYYRNASVPRTIDTSAGFTVNIWVYTTAYNTGSTGNIFNHRANPGTSPGHWYLTSAVTTGIEAWQEDCTTALPVTSFRRVIGTAATLNSWHMMTAVSDSVSTRLYKDGSLVGTDTAIPVARPTIDEPLAIGCAAYNVVAAGRHQGRVSMAGVWGVALTPAQITALYNSGQGKRFAALL